MLFTLFKAWNAKGDWTVEIVELYRYVMTWYIYGSFMQSGYLKSHTFLCGVIHFELF